MLIISCEIDTKTHKTISQITSTRSKTERRNIERLQIDRIGIPIVALVNGGTSY